MEVEKYCHKESDINKYTFMNEYIFSYIDIYLLKKTTNVVRLKREYL